MTGKYLPDTNIIIALFSGEHSIAHRIRDTVEIFLPSVALGELYYGAYQSSKKQTNIKRVDERRTQIDVLSCDENTARHHGQIKTRLKERCSSIPENDIWIAAIAIQHRLHIATVTCISSI